MDPESAWKRLEPLAAELREAARAAPLHAADVAASAERMLDFIRPMVREAGQELAARLPHLAGRVQERSAEPPALAFPHAPVVLYGNASEAEVISAWEAQLRMNVEGAAGFTAGDRGRFGEFMMGWVEARPEVLDFFRAEHLRDCLREVNRLAALLAAPRKTIRVIKKQTLFKDDFTRGFGNWTCYGPGHVATDGPRLSVAGAGNTFWLAHDFADAVISLDFTPMTLEGPGAGALFAFPATPRQGFGFEASAGPMEQYNYGINTYHCSLCRGSSGVSNLRRTGRGLRLLSSVRPDPCREPGRTYHVDFLKHGVTVQVHIDGRLLHSYFDAATYGAPPTQGRFGVRHFSAQRLIAYYADVEVCELRVGS